MNHQGRAGTLIAILILAGAGSTQAQTPPPGTASYSFSVENDDLSSYQLFLRQTSPSGATQTTFLSVLDSGYYDACGNFYPASTTASAWAAAGDTYSLVLADFGGTPLAQFSLGVATNGVQESDTFAVQGGTFVFWGSTSSYLPPWITVQPSDQTVTEGDQATFTVAAQSAFPLTLQWEKNGIPIPGASAASYTTDPLTLADQGAIFGAVVTNVGGTTVSQGATLTVLSSGSLLPRPWIDRDIGAPPLPGSASYAPSGGAFTLSGSGSDFGGLSDQGHLAFQILSGDGEISARVTGLGNAAGTGKAGVMIRESLGADSTFVFAGVTLGGGSLFESRAVRGNPVQVAAGPASVLPTWVRLLRTGDTFQGFLSSDGTTWAPLATPVTIPMASTLLVGLAVTSQSGTSSAVATVDEASGSGGWSLALTGNGSPGRESDLGGCGTTGLEAGLLLALGAWIRRRRGNAGSRPPARRLYGVSTALISDPSCMPSKEALHSDRGDTRLR